MSRHNTRSTTVTTLADAPTMYFPSVADISRAAANPPKPSPAARTAPATRTTPATMDERIARLEKIINTQATDLVNARAQIDRLTHRLEIAEVAVVREMQQAGSWQDPAMTAMEGDFQRLIERVHQSVRARSRKAGYSDYDRDAQLTEMWGSSDPF